MALNQVCAAFAQGRLTVNPLDDGSGVVVDTQGERLLTMNATGMALVEAIEAGANDEAALTSALTQRFEVAPDRALADARAFVNELAKSLG